MSPGLRSQLGYVIRASSVMVRDPLAGMERVKGRLSRREDDRAFLADRRSIDEIYPIDVEWLLHLHQALECEWPCVCGSEAEALYAEIMEMFRSRGLPEKYADWCDGGRGFTIAAWCLTRHLRPQTVVETGVARGVTSRFVLDALEQNGDGHLSSVDLPSTDPRFHSQIGIAVPERHRDRWTLVSGSSRQQLPGLLTGLGEIDLFVHDSLHTGSNTRFELHQSWEVLRPGGAMLVDDVYQSLAFSQFVADVQPKWFVIGANADASYRFGVILKTADLAEALQASARAV
jgi:Methyltransferase domain